MERSDATLGAVVTLLVVGASPHQLAAQSNPTSPALVRPASHEVAAIGSPRRDLLASVLAPGGESPARQMKVDLGPALDWALGFLHQHGIPLRQDDEESGNGIVFSAAFYMSEALPPMQFRIGDRGPLDAFYANDGGFRVALSWIIPTARQFALHLEAGEDSEFGNWAIAGVQWHHPRRPLVIGIGMPVALSGADGPVGVICQIRMPLD